MNIEAKKRKGPGRSHVTKMLEEVELGDSTIVKISDYSTEASARYSIINAAKRIGVRFTAQKLYGGMLLVTRVE